MSRENNKREQAEKLLRAMSEIDDRFLLEAMKAEEWQVLSGQLAETAGETITLSEQTAKTAEQTPTRRNKLRRYSRWALTAAACLTVVVVGRYVSVNTVKTGSEKPAVVSDEMKDTEKRALDMEVAEEAPAAEEAPMAEEIDGEEADVDYAGETATAGSAGAAEKDSAAEVSSAAETKNATQDSALRPLSSGITEKGAEAAGAGAAAALGMPNPFIDADSLEEVEEAAGFDIQLPEVKESFETQIYRAMPDQMIEVIYKDSKDREVCRIRKGKNMEDDISGVWNEDVVSDTLKAGDLEITVTGQEKDKWETAVWTMDAEDGDHYSYSITTDQAGMTSDEVIQYAKEMTLA